MRLAWLISKLPTLAKWLCNDVTSNSCSFWEAVRNGKFMKPRGGVRVEKGGRQRERKGTEESRKMLRRMGGRRVGGG